MRVWVALFGDSMLQMCSMADSALRTEGSAQLCDAHDVPSVCGTDGTEGAVSAQKRDGPRDLFFSEPLSRSARGLRNYKVFFIATSERPVKKARVVVFLPPAFFLSPFLVVPSPSLLDSACWQRLYRCF